MRPASKIPKSVVFAPQPDIRIIAPRSRLRKSTLKMSVKVFESFDGEKVTDDMLGEASKLFAENYGLWSEQAAQVMGKFAKAGKCAFTRVWLPR